MASSPPFIDSPSGTVDTTQLLREAIPLTKLIGLVAMVALGPFALAVGLGVFQRLFTLLTQFILAIGGSIVLMYVITRAIQLADE
ncbi:hypothetical protein KZ498_16860 [Haloarcula sp. 1CSR25-25]|jgi:hypothetical protein|nr:hypothetical protein [Haloarcula sp. 1CSR25-25]